LDSFSSSFKEATMKEEKLITRNDGT